jgi:hypothetical protein
MSRRHVDTTENAELRAKIDEARPQLPLPKLMRQLNYDKKHIRTSAVCSFHKDEHPSFSVFQARTEKAGSGNALLVAAMATKSHFW